MANTDEAPTPKRAKVENFYVSASGERASRPQPDVIAVGKKFLESGYEQIMPLRDLPKEQALQNCAFGLQQVTQNAYGNVETESDRIEASEARAATIFGGSWASDRQVGPSTTDVIEAYLQAKAEQTGRTMTEDDRTAFKTKLDNETLTAKSVLENAAIRAKYDRIKADRAADRARKSGEAAAAAAQIDF